MDDDIKFFYAKLGRGNCLASEYLAGRTPINHVAVPIFFNGVPANRADFEKDSCAKEQGKNFFWCADNPNLGYIVIIHEGKIYLARPDGPVQFRNVPEDTRHLKAHEFHKLLPISIQDTRPLSGAPANLSSMTANTYLRSGTFREIRDKGNVRALQSLFKMPMDSLDCNDPEQLLGCLGSIELETLIAKLFEDSGCFVPAYRGGAIKGIDIFAKNLGPTDITVGNRIHIRSNSEVSIQVKRHSPLKEPPTGCDELISLTNDAEWLLGVIKDSEKTRKWLMQSFSWIPSDVLRNYGLS